MAVHCGLDLISVARIEQAVIRRGQPFLDRIWTAAEQALCGDFQQSSGLSRTRQAEFLAGRFAAKEAVAKAFGTGIGAHISLTDIEILQTADGSPQVTLYRGAAAHYQRQQGVSLTVSITHDSGLAAAVCILETTDPSPAAQPILKQ